MKKILYTMLVALAATFSFTSCEDVPAPYDTPNGGNGGGTENTLNTIYSETFDNNKTNFTFKDVSLTGGLTYVWKVASYNDNGYLNASAFASNASHASESWAVSPAIVLNDSKKATLSFKHAINKLNDASTMKDMMTVWASTNYAGDVTTATWDKLEIPTYPAGTSWTFVESGDIDLTSYCGKSVYIAFKYTSTDSNSGGWEVDNFEVKGDGTAMEQPSTPDVPTTGDPTGTGTKEDPFNVAAANKYINDGGDATAEVYVKGIVSELKEFRSNYGSISYYISDDGTTANQFYVYGGNNLGNTSFTKLEDLKVGDKVVICGKLKSYNGTNEFDSRNYLVSLNGQTEGGSTGGDEPSTPTEGGMGITEVIGGKTSSTDLPTNAYGSQTVADEASWYTWKYNNVNYTGVRICKASESNGKGGIQLQGGTEAAKQGFIFNSSAFGSDIKTITLYVRGSNKYDTPTTFSLFEGTAAHPTANKLEGKVTGPVADGDFNTFTITFTFTAGNRFFTIWNNAQGALYIDKIAVELN